MPFTFDFLDDGRVLEWETTADGAVATERDDYSPRFYVASRAPDDEIDLTRLRSVYERHPDVVATDIVAQRPGFRRDDEDVLAVDVAHIDRITSLARQARQLSEYPVGDLACFNVDLSREFRYCLENDVDPTPTCDLSTLRLDVPLTETTGDAYTELAVGGETVTGPPEDILTTVQAALDNHDPDVLVCSTSEIVPTLYEMAASTGADNFSLSRTPKGDFQQLASRSTYASYGRVGHSPARYNVPGRAIIDRSNTFFFGETNIDGVLDLVSRSRKPIQEAAWASIGNILTAIQICEAHDRGVLVPWHSWRHEKFKSTGVLHDADRGGFIFAPEVGLHEDVHELDFSSLYPNIICTHNVSPDVIRCECHRDREDVPGLGYSICDDRGYLVDVLQPIIDARDEIKAAIRREQERDDPDKERLDELEGRSGALKWILVACFGYQGFNNAKYGRIECHEAINAFAREILLTAKQRLEAAGWRVVHGIVDSIWVTPNPDVDDEDRESLEALATEITEAVDIRLEYESHYDWVAFVPQRESDAGALTKYFGKVVDEDEFKIRGIEARQRSTPPFIEDVQRECLDRLDATQSPEAVLSCLDRAVSKLHAGEVAVERLVERNRVSKPLDGYTQNTQNVAALKRARDQDLAVHPGQDIEYVVVDDEKSSRERVVLAHEEVETYDPSYYETQLVRAVESVLSPLGWDRTDIRRSLAETREVELTDFTMT
ncbi:DNA polymerase B2 exonuclease domain (plasmid) [Haloarcula marismortui ATCC 43049]|uniref:DNA-directed DNA polymerase n=1 Tax=Haloarcula marismortui (strain ATCC 43049 / DSM 3752 / JCM 8966 / VKM B-1809) TaxID=272569 RepID=Q5V7A9_HALMA|nr:type B DNA-directed DNA polymerase [Haloarcula marismortui]AAV44711.1 DNA polymerase B2 exonuclease domain [Haloarcula marismortui ATCC 43049]QCP89576.1 type B DNA-directed DNA polymerase [Haloarcula marismortui ATCC 43049]